MHPEYRHRFPDRSKILQNLLVPDIRPELCFNSALHLGLPLITRDLALAGLLDHRQSGSPSNDLAQT